MIMSDDTTTFIKYTHIFFNNIILPLKYQKYNTTTSNSTRHCKDFILFFYGHKWFYLIHFTFFFIHVLLVKIMVYNEMGHEVPPTSP